MKKENKVLAQQKRAKARQKQSIQSSLWKITKIAAPILAAVILLLLIIIDPFTEPEKEIEVPEVTLLTDASYTIENGDDVNIDFVGYVDGVPFEGGDSEGNGYTLTIGSGTFIDDFEEQLIGHHPGEEVEVNVTFPDPYSSNPDLAGKEAVFDVTINGIFQYEETE